MKGKTIAVILVVAATQTGCSSLVGESLFTGEDEGRFLISADAEGLRAWNDGLNGIITNTKEPEGQKSAHWQLREQETGVKALKFRVRKAGGAK